MKRVLKIMLLLFVFTFGILRTTNVKSGGVTDYNGGTGGSFETQTGGDYNDINGFRIAILNSSGSAIVGGTRIIDVINLNDDRNGCRNYYFLSPKQTKVIYNKNAQVSGRISFGTWSQGTSTIYVGGKCSYQSITSGQVYDINSVSGADDFGDFVYPGYRRDTYLRDNDFKNLKAFMKLAGYDCDGSPSMCDRDHYVAVEIVFQRNSYIGTGFEMSALYSDYGSHYSIYGNTANILYVDASKVGGTGYLLGIKGITSSVDKGTAAMNAMKNSESGYGIGLFKVGDIICTPGDPDCPDPDPDPCTPGSGEPGCPIERELTIYKRKAAGATGTTPLITGKNFKFGIYDDSSCSSFVNYCISTGSSSCTVTGLSPGIYYYKELQAPIGYKLDPACKSSDSINLTSSDASKTVYNTPECVADFEEMDSDGIVTMVERMKLYATYTTFNGLLDTSKTTGPDACVPVSSTVEVSLGCLETSSVNLKIDGGLHNLSDFNANDVSAYNTVLKDSTTSEIIGYCLAYPEITTTSGPSYTGKLGRMLIKADTTPNLGVAAKIKVHKKCYVYKSGTPVNDFVDFDDYISGASLTFSRTTLSGLTENFQILSDYSNKSLTGGLVSGSISTGALYEYSVEVPVPFKSVFSHVGTGTLKFTNTTVNALGESVKPSGSNSYSFLGFGFATKYTDTATTGTLPFNFTPNTASGFSNVQVTSTGSCSYSITNDYPKFEYKSVDVNNPFPGKNYNLAMSITTRTVGNNWSSKAITGYNVIGGVGNNCRLTLTTLGTGFTKLDNIDAACDLNKDAFLDSEDLDILLYANGDYAPSDKGDNYLVKYVMEERNDSNDSKGTGPKYEIELTSKDISVIRDYNSTHTYDDYDSDVTCVIDTKDCTSEFFDSLKLGRTPSGDSLSNGLIVN